MGSTARKLQRATAKKMYKKFCANWREAIAEQSALHETGNRLLIDARRQERYAERGNPILGKRPTFKQWYSSVLEMQRKYPAPIIDEVEDLDWDD